MKFILDKKYIQHRLGEISGLDDVLQVIIKSLKETSLIDKINQIGFVSGVISSDGPEKVRGNLTRLKYYTKKIREKEGFQVFSPTDIFTNRVFERIKADNIPNNQWFDFYREILTSGYVTDIFMTPRWEISDGAKVEYNTAREVGLKIHIVKKSIVH